MKELSIEEKAKRYDEAIERANSKWHYKNQPCFVDVVEIFPELKESKDEKIRKKIIATIHLYYGEPLEDEAKEMIAWLEKQGEQKPAVIIPKFKVGDTMRTLQEAKDGWTDGMPFVVSIDSEYYNCNSEKIAIEDQDEYEFPPMNRKQKSAWSEEDNIMVHDIDCALRCQITYPVSRLQFMSTWIDSLKDRVQPKVKQEWSEEDKAMVEDIIEAIDTQYAITDYNEMVNWLKSLKDRYTWKPSELQIEALAIAIRCGIKLGTWEEEALKDLIEQLKRLKS